MGRNCVTTICSRFDPGTPRNTARHFRTFEGLSKKRVPSDIVGWTFQGRELENGRYFGVEALDAVSTTCHITCIEDDKITGIVGNREEIPLTFLSWMRRLLFPLRPIREFAPWTPRKRSYPLLLHQHRRVLSRSLKIFLERVIDNRHPRPLTMAIRGLPERQNQITRQHTQNAASVDSQTWR